MYVFILLSIYAAHNLTYSNRLFAVSGVSFSYLPLVFKITIKVWLALSVHEFSSFFFCDGFVICLVLTNSSSAQVISLY